MNVTPFGAKSSENTVVGVAADADGNLITKKSWENTITQTPIISQTEIPSSEFLTQETPFDTTPYALISLRVRNDTDRKIRLRFFQDTTSSVGRYLRNHDGDPINVLIPAAIASRNFYAVTPEDLPILQYLMRLKIEVEFEDGVPTTMGDGGVQIWVVAKK